MTDRAQALPGVIVRSQSNAGVLEWRWAEGVDPLRVSQADRYRMIGDFYEREVAGMIAGMPSREARIRTLDRIRDARLHGDVEAREAIADRIKDRVKALWATRRGEPAQS